MIVIGAGPAGSTAAREISSLGWEVLLLDKSTEHICDCVTIK